MKLGGGAAAAALLTLTALLLAARPARAQLDFGESLESNKCSFTNFQARRVLVNMSCDNIKQMSSCTCPPWRPPPRPAPRPPTE